MAEQLDSLYLSHCFYFQSSYRTVTHWQSSLVSAGVNYLPVSCFDSYLFLLIIPTGP